MTFKKAYCKNNLNEFNFIEGNYYDIQYYDGESYWILNRNHDGFVMSYRFFEFDKYTNNYLFSNYFLTLSECRKIKLDRINDSIL